MPSAPLLPHRLYEHRPKPFSNALMLDLGTHSLLAERGRSKQEYPLSAIEQIRLSYTPANTARLGFACEIRATDGKTLKFSNLTWRSMVETGRQDEDYAPFVRELVARVARANPKVALISGAPGWKYRLFQAGAIIIAPALLATAALFLWRGAWPVAVLTLGILAWFAFYAREYLTRNAPGTFAPQTLPAPVMPSLAPTA
jgi:hypothetical protein